MRSLGDNGLIQHEGTYGRVPKLKNPVARTLGCVNLLTIKSQKFES